MIDAICFGSIIVDHRRAWSPPAGPSEPLRIVEKAVDLRVGGVPILAVALGRMGFRVALMGRVGRDIAGYGLKAHLAAETGLDVDAVRMIDAPTSSSFIRLTNEQRYVDHTPGAGAQLLPDAEDVAFVQRHKPRLLAIGYCGLLPRLDADGGAKMAEWIAAVAATGAIVALDTHTVPPYEMLAKPVPRADVFLCNAEEGRGVTGLADAPPEDVVEALWSRFPPAGPARYRLLGVAMPEGVQLAYGNGDGHTAQWVPNPHFGTFVPSDLTGAGDAFRAGVYAELIRGSDRFRAGGLDLALVGAAGHDSACRHLRSTSR